MADTNTKDGTEEPGIVTASLTLGLFMSVITTVMFVRCGHVGWAWGFSVGAGISLISMFSIRFLVPRLTMPMAPGTSQSLLALALFLKLPFYTIALYMVTRMPGVDARSVFPGILVSPIAITTKTVVVLIWQSASEAAYRWQIRRGGSKVIGARRGRVGARRPLAPEPVSEQG